MPINDLYFNEVPFRRFLIKKTGRELERWIASVIGFANTLHSQNFNMNDHKNFEKALETFNQHARTIAEEVSGNIQYHGFDI